MKMEGPIKISCTTYIQTKNLCSVQGKLAAFSVVGAERHKTLRLVLQDYRIAVEENRQKKSQI